MRENIFYLSAEGRKETGNTAGESHEKNDFSMAVLECLKERGGGE